MRLIRSGLVRYAALALALVASGGQALSGLHFALVPHVTCAEHGELIESPSVSAQPIRSCSRIEVWATAVFPDSATAQAIAAKIRARYNGRILNLSL